MMSHKRLNTINTVARFLMPACIAFSIALPAHAQYNYMVRGNGHTLLETSAVQLPSPETFRGTMVWQKSADKAHWSVIMSSGAPDTLDVEAGAPAMYRLALGEGTCDTLYSDTVTVGSTDDLNDMLAEGFSISDFINEGIPLDSMVADSVPVSGLLEGGFPIDTLYKHGISVERLAGGGVTVDELLNTKIPLNDIYEWGFLVGTLEQHGVDSLDLVAAGLIGTVADYDGNVYKWVKIGDQIWMAENLKVTHWQGGTVIQTTTDPNEDIEGWPANDARRQWAYNGVEDNADIYGRLYTYYAIEGDSVCPSGWHVPDSLEFDGLANFLGGYDVAGGKLKSVSSLWDSPNTGATNESGFNALPAASRSRKGSFGALGRASDVWSISRINVLFFEIERVDKYPVTYKESGFSVRCLKD